MHVIMTGCDGVTNFEVRSKALGIHSSLQTFDLLCGVMLGEKLYAITDMLSRSLQAKDVTASDAKLSSEAIYKNIVRLRSDEEFDSFWEKATTKASELQLSDPVLPRNRRPPRRLDCGSNPCSFSNQLSVLSDVVEGVKPSLRDIECSLKSFQSTSSLFSEVIKLLQLLYVLPASTATAERSFSSLRRLKT